jgi:hypothetical protein
MSVVEFPTDTAGMLATLQEMYRDGTIREIIIYAPNAKDGEVFHFNASGGIQTRDVLMAKHSLEVLAHKLWGRSDI